MKTTQEHLSIADIKEDIVILRDGGGALILQCSAVNFGLLSDREQIAIISAFAQMLNSLSFPLQIVIRSERLNINSYLDLLDRAQKAQTNSLLSQLMVHYRQFIQNTIKENEVLDKKFYVVIPLYKLELGMVASLDSLYQKIKTVLLPRRDQVIRQLSRVGLKTTQLDNEKLVELFFDIYNGIVWETPLPPPVKLTQPKTAQSQQPVTTPLQPEIPTPKVEPKVVSQRAKDHPFVVEELEDQSA